MTAQHTGLTLRNFSAYAMFAFVIGLVAVGFGAVDLLMVSVLGLKHVAAVGQGDLIATCLLASFVGFVDVFAARLAATEGSGERGKRQISLAIGFLYAVILCAMLALAFSTLIRPALIMLRQVDELIEPINAYVVYRLVGVAPFLIYMAASEALKISGLRTHALQILMLGFVLNAAFNALFLYSPAAEIFDSPEAAVAIATVLAQVFMGTIAVYKWVERLKDTSVFELIGIQDLARQNLFVLLRTAPGVGARILNDYVGTVLPILFIGTMNTGVVAATAIATKIYTLFCRIPQATFSASYVYYCYGLESRKHQPVSEETRRIIRILLRYTVWPTVIALVATLAISPWLIRQFGGEYIDIVLTQNLLWAYLIFIPMYFFEQFYGELLTAHGRAGLLFRTSTIATYFVTIPIAYVAVFHWQSAFLAVLGRGGAMTALAFLYWSQFRQSAPSSGTSSNT